MNSVRSDSLRLTNQESARYLMVSSITVAVVIIWGSIVAFVNGYPSLLWFVIPPAIACLVAPIYVRRGGRTRVAEHLLLSSSLACVLGLGLATGGQHLGGLMWAIFIPALAVVIRGRKSGVVYGSITLSALIAITVIHRLNVPTLIAYPTGYAVTDFLYKASLAMCAVTMLAMGVRARLEAHHNALAKRKQFDLIGKMTGSVAHDFNNLLAVIVGNLELLDELLDEKAAGKQLVQEIRGAAMSGSDLVRNLQALSQQRRLDPRPVPIAKQVEESLPLIRRTVAKDGIELRLNDRSEGAVAVVDPAQFDSVLLNLCMNARDALPDGGDIEIVLRSEDSAGRGGKVVIEVSDNGRGMSEEVLNNALQPFYTTKAVGDGSGLGLAMVHTFAERAGGDVTLHSRPGAGTRVAVSLPSMAPTYQPAEDVVSGPAPGGDEHVLAVDDEPGLLKACKQMLESLGYRVSLAANAREAQEILTTDPTISAVFTDRVMPGSSDGYQLARWVKETYPEIAVLMTSGFAGPKPGDRTIPLLHKPYSRQDLASGLRRVIDGGEGSRIALS
ncbi:MAG: ATP-binding protein [Pseudomonadota bacterium]